MLVVLVSRLRFDDLFCLSLSNFVTSLYPSSWRASSSLIILFHQVVINPKPNKDQLLCLVFL